MALTDQRESARDETHELPPKLADGVELIGEYEGSGFKEPPSLARRSDGQVIQLPPLLYAVAARADGQRDYALIAREVSEEIGRGLDAEQVRFLAEEKLRPIGVLAAADGSSPQLEKPDPFLALRFRAAVISEKMSDRLGAFFKPLFLPLVVLAALGAFVAVDIWLFFMHGVAQALRESIYHPGLFLPLFAAVVLSAAFHEIGHAAACRYGGGHPGKMGCGIYLAWPAFYTDVTDAYRLGRRARLRTDLGGVYFNVVFVLLTTGAYFTTGFEPLLLLVVIQHFEIAHQLLPVVRLDGYYIVADLTGVPDLFARIGPILRSLVPWRRADERVTVLKRWVRVAITAWVLIVVPLLLLELFIVLMHLPRIIGTAWDSAHAQMNTATAAFGAGDVLQGISAVLQLIVLVIPVAGIVLMLYKMATGLLRSGWQRTEGRPVGRVLFGATVAAAVGLLLFAWVPSDNYEPIRPGERGTVAEGVAAVRRLPQGDAPLYSEQQAVLRETPLTPDQQPQDATTASSVPATSPSSTATTVGTGGSSTTTTTEPVTTTSSAPTTTAPTTTAPTTTTPAN
ncbi:MAG: putative peptide zinc metalloprotease protein [Acidimicrobiaceae bacterium]